MTGARARSQPSARIRVSAVLYTQTVPVFA